MSLVGLPTERKIGAGITFFLAHATVGDQAASPFNGEQDLLTMVAQATAVGANLGAVLADGHELTVTAETIPDEIAQEAFPVQAVAVAATAQFKAIGMNMGDADKFAISQGFGSSVDESDVLGTGDDADTVVLSVRPPSLYTLLNRVINPHNSSYYDYLYLPRVAVDFNLIYMLKKKEFRTADVVFNCFASTQDGTTSGSTTSEDLYIDENETFAFGKIYEQTST
jgi:hypothetical protein